VDEKKMTLEPMSPIIHDLNSRTETAYQSQTCQKGGFNNISSIACIVGHEMKTNNIGLTPLTPGDPSPVVNPNSGTIGEGLKEEMKCD